MIKEKLNCDILELKPKIAFSSDYQSVVDEYQNKKKEKSTVEIEDINIDFDNYDEIIIGSPVWWYSITPVIRSFLKENNLEGKTIVPFATNAGWLGRTFKEIKELCENYSDNLVTSIDEINNWIDRI